MSEASLELRDSRDSRHGAILERGRAAGLLTGLDLQFARRLGALFGVEDEAALWGLAIACHQQADGHVCADLDRLAQDGIVTEVEGVARVHPVLVTHDAVEAWRAALLATPLFDAPDASGETPESPAVVDERGRVYLSRAHRAERALATVIRSRVGAPDFDFDASWSAPAIERLTGGSDTASAAALESALRRPLTIVTGGPGTGKTTLVVRLVAALVEQAIEAGAPLPRVALLAPTGKAAAAMAGAFARGRDGLEADEAVKAALPTQAGTLQRALYGQLRRDAFGRSADVQIDADVVVVDESSMVDLELMARLFAACEKAARVVLVGDPDQLASVESGAVLGELVGGTSGQKSSALEASVVRLTRSHRFEAGGAIGRLAAAIRDGEADAVIDLLDDPALPDVERVSAARPQEVVARVVAESEAMHREIAGAEDPIEKLERMGRYRVLCAHRRGPLGIESLGARLDDAAARVHATTPRAGWWRGRLLLVTRNAPDQDLWNGDVGLIDELDSELRAIFPDGRGGVRRLSAGRLPSHESAIAMSVHKSQGSEFDEVDLVLGDRPSPIMTRELFYTGVTRARRRLRVHASDEAIRAMLDRRIVRDSGLADRLRGD